MHFYAQYFTKRKFMTEFDARPNLKRPEANPSLPPKLHLLQFKDCDKSVNINPIETNLASLVGQCMSYKLTKFQLISCTKILGNFFHKKSLKNLTGANVVLLRLI